MGDEEERDPFAVAQIIAASMSTDLVQAWTRCPWCCHDYEYVWDDELLDYTNEVVMHDAAGCELRDLLDWLAAPVEGQHDA